MSRAARSSSQVTEGARPEPTLPGIPDKEYFRIGEAARLVGVKPYVLRYWEGEFKRDIRPERSRSNQRMYRRRDIETFLEIKRLRYEEKLELPGAKRQLRKPAAAPPAEAPAPPADGHASQPPQDLRAVAPPASAPRPDPTAQATELANRLADGLRDLLRIVDEDEKGE